MSTVSWGELRVVLGDLLTRDPRPLQGYPDPRAGDPHLPTRIQLTPWAVDVARGLHERFGDDVILTVGALSFPGHVDEVEVAREPSSAPVLDPADVEVSAPEPLVVRAGEDVRTELRVTNHRRSPISISAGPSVLGRVLDPSTGEVVGGFSGAVAAVLRMWTIEPGATLALPFVVGTASYMRSLGYTVPPGEWSVEVVLHLAEGERRVLPLPLRIAERDNGPIGADLG